MGIDSIHLQEDQTTWAKQEPCTNMLFLRFCPCQNPIVGQATMPSIGIRIVCTWHPYTENPQSSSVIDHEVNNWLEVGACHPCSVHPGGLAVLVVVTGFLCLPQELHSSTSDGFTILCPDFGQSSSKPGANDAVPHKIFPFTFHHQKGN